jgi:RNA polymerase sigma-70 factor (ECF subfamily)
MTFAPPYTSHSDTADFLRARAGDEAAFTALANRQRPYARAVAMRLLGSRADAEDAVQEALIRVWNARDSFRADSVFLPWFTRIVTNAARDIARRRAVRHTEQLEDTASELLSTLDDLSETTIHRAAADAFASAVTKLPRRRQKIVIMHDVHGVVHGEIAGMLEIPVGTVRAELSYARKQLRVALAEWR